MEKTSCTDRVKNEDVLFTVIDDRNIPHTIKGRKAKYFGKILCRNYFLKHFIQGKTERRREVTGRRGRRCK